MNGPPGGGATGGGATGRASSSPAPWRDGASPDPLWSRVALLAPRRFRRLGLAIDVAASDAAGWVLAEAAFGAAVDVAMVDRTRSGAAYEAGDDGVARAPHDAAGAADGTGVVARGARSKPAGDGASTVAPADLRLHLVVGPPPGGDGTGGAVTNRSGVGQATAAAPSGPPSPTLFRERDRWFVGTDGHGGVVMADLAEGVAVAWCVAGAPAAAVVGHLLEAPLWRLATWRGWLAVHAAAVVVDGAAVVVRGPSGAGKSAVAAAADAAGVAVLAEEVAWLEPSRRVVRGGAVATHEARAGGDRAAGAAGSAVARAAAKRRRGLATPAPDVDVPLGPLVFIEPPTPARRQPAATWRAVASAAAVARLEAERIAGEHAQPAERWRRGVEALAARAYVLAGGTAAERVAVLAAIVADARRSASGVR